MRWWICWCQGIIKVDLNTLNVNVYFMIWYTEITRLSCVIVVLTLIINCWVCQKKNPAGKYLRGYYNIYIFTKSSHEICSPRDHRNFVSELDKYLSSVKQKLCFCLPHSCSCDCCSFYKKLLLLRREDVADAKKSATLCRSIRPDLKWFL